ncbi:MAG: glycosyl hydrolase family 18 protein [Melioribacteraceae bacterium]
MTSQILSQNKEIIGGFQSWKWQQFPVIFNPQNIPYDKLTIINYSFFYPLETGEIVGLDPVADRFLLKGESDLVEDGEVPGESIIELAKQHGTKIVLSIGGWETSNNFPQVSADPVKRANFAHWCVKHIKNYGFEGIDIDWEFPGYKKHNGTPNDRENFTILLQQIRDSLNVYGIKSEKKLILTASLPAAAVHLVDMEVEKIGSIVDYINIMTYDLYGSWGKKSNHNSALYAPAEGDPGRCLDGAFKLYHETHNVPSKKITLCATFFGYSYSNCSEIYGTHTGADTTIFKEGGDLLYSQIYEKMDQFNSYWDSTAQSPYLIGKTNKILISLDNEKSVAQKMDYIINNKGGGIIIWPLMGDYLKNGKTPLLDAISQEFSK